MALQSRRTGTSVLTGKVRASYAHLFTPKRGDNADPTSKEKYSVSLLIPKDDKQTFENIKAALGEAGRAKWGDKFGTVAKTSGFKMGLRDGDVDRADDPAYKGCWFINVNSEKKPTCLDQRGVPITSPELLRSGDYIRAYINAFAYDNKSKGVTCGLNHVQLVERGDPLSGGPDAASVFTPIDSEETGAAAHGGADEIDDILGMS